MISERRFCSLHRNFWRAVMPRSEQMTRLLNASKKVLLPKYTSQVEASNRGLINEAATRLASFSLAKDCPVASLTQEQRNHALADAYSFIERFRSGHEYQVDLLRRDEEIESNDIAGRLLEMFQLLNAKPKMFVLVPGAGIIDACEVDAVDVDAVFEIKAGNRNCRSEDIRQALVYAALLELSGQVSQVKTIEVLNPRLGWRVTSGTDSLLELAGGKDWGSFRGEFENYIVDTMHAHQIIDRIIEPFRSSQ